MRQIIIDTETTGLSPQEGHRIIEIGCVELLNRRMTGRRYQQFLNPERDIDSEAQAVHGISRESLLDKPVFAAVASEFLAFIKDAELIIHNAPFDLGFLDHELGLTGLRRQKLADDFQITDTLILARQIHPGQRNSLDALCKRYGVDNSRRELHGALMDAHLLAQVYLAMTGGQASLFDLPGLPAEVGTQDEDAVLGMAELSAIIPHTPLRVINADSDELRCHQDKLTAMQKQGKCLWENTP